jgi:PAS domain S-box-containing protein
LILAHRGVRANEERLRMAVEVAQMSAWEWDVETGELTWSNDPEPLFRFPPGAIGPQRPLFNAIHPEDRDRMAAAIDTAIATGVYEGEYRLVRPDGSVAWVTERGRAIGPDRGLVERLVGVCRDVTAEREAVLERERLLESERKARDEAERQGRLKDDFLATLSHELRTPMNIVLGWLQILTTGGPVRDVAAVLNTILQNARLQAKLIDDLLDMNRLVSGALHLETAPVDIGGALLATIQGLKPAADAKNIQLIAGVPTPRVEVVGDAKRLQQVLWNLLHNAIKFTPPNGRVELSVSEQDAQVQVTVRDNGRGISSAFLPHVFERFRQENSSYNREFSGLGLGLSIAKHLVEAHGGSIDAHSDGDGLGATFTVRLPAQAVTGALAVAL